MAPQQASTVKFPSIDVICGKAARSRYHVPLAAANVTSPLSLCHMAALGFVALAVQQTFIKICIKARLFGCNVLTA